MKRSLLAAGCLIGVWNSAIVPAAAEEAVDAKHQHAPVVLDARPIVSRFDVPLERPRRLLLDESENLFVADWNAGAVLKVAADGKVSIVVDRLNEPSGLALDRMGSLYVSTYAGGRTGAGTVVKVPPMGKPSLFAEGLSGPMDIAFDAEDNLYVACYDHGAILRISADGQGVLVAADVEAPSALAVDGQGQVFVASATAGRVLRLSGMGELTEVARGLAEPSDLAFDRAGRLFVVNLSGTELTYIDDKGRLETFALVPKGTNSVVFTADRNFILSNGPFGLLLKVISYLDFPCPHCEKKIPVRLKPSQPPPEPPRQSGPVI